MSLREPLRLYLLLWLPAYVANTILTITKFHLPLTHLFLNVVPYFCFRINCDIKSLHNGLLIFGSPDNGLRFLADLQIGFRVPAMVTFFWFSTCPSLFYRPPLPIKSNCYWGIFLGIKWLGSESHYLLPTCKRVKNKRIYSFTSLHILIS